MKMENISMVKIQKIGKKIAKQQDDFLVVEEPLEIRVAFGSLKNRKQKSISVTMRTPGNDFELATGFLFTEGIIERKEDILKIDFVQTFDKASRENIVKLELSPEVGFDIDKLERHFYTSSSCGVCGKASIEAVHASEIPDLEDNFPNVKAALFYQLPKRLKEQQSLFEHTGGLHAAALFDQHGNLLLLREDIGRHNAVDKLIGALLLKKQLPLSKYIILVSGRAGFELVQKSLIAGIPIMAAVGAPSSLAVRLAMESGMTLIGFLKEEKYNIYTHPQRIIY